MSLVEFRQEADSDIQTLLAPGFSIEVTKTKTVPHSNDQAITFPNLEKGVQRCKLIETTVLYIDLRRSTNLNLEHKPQTVAKLYSAFVRSMTLCARYHNGHVRGIIGDRVMVIFDTEKCFYNAVKTAIIMNSVVQYILDEHFGANDIKCGIGIDYGRMLVTKTGIRKNGNENHNYKSLVWLGRPANVASKLTDLANKTTELAQPVVIEGHRGPWDGYRWDWDNPVTHDAFLDRLKETHTSNHLFHTNPNFGAFIKTTRNLKHTTKPIMMTKIVKDGYYREAPEAESVKNNWWSKVVVDVPGYNGEVWHGDVHFTEFTPAT